MWPVTKCPIRHSGYWGRIAGIATTVEAAEAVYDIGQAGDFQSRHAIGPGVDNNWLTAR